MAAMKKVKKIRQIVRLKQIMMRWRLSSLRLTPTLSNSDSSSICCTPSNFLTVYVEAKRICFVIPARFVNFLVFAGLLDMATEEFGFETTDIIVLPCEVSFFKEILKLLEKDKKKLGKLSLDQFLQIIATDVGFDSCKAAFGCGGSSFTPLLLQEARV